MSTLASVQLELGPFPTEAVTDWVRFARRVLCEIRMDPGELDDLVDCGLLDDWSSLISAWDSIGASSGDEFRWSTEMDSERAEYLLHGLDRCLRSAELKKRITTDEALRYSTVTTLVIQAFIDGLVAEGSGCLEYVEQLRAGIARGV